MNGTPAPTEAWRPILLHPRNPADCATLAQLHADGRVRETYDTLLEQLRDLAAARHPRRKLSEVESREAVAGLLGGLPPAEYGRWIFYPWSGRLVHLLDRDEFREVRTNRNRNKITAAEQARLGQATVGIVGLSVGNAVARTLALEGVGTLKLADFDRLDLSNLNRLQAGVHDIGVNKAVLAARQIVELDPDAQIEVFPEGITAGNLDAFLDGSPRLDVLVDECDSLDIKCLLRERAREKRLPVLMETSDRGMLDVERFDLEPDRAIFHGLAGDLRAADLRGLSTAKKVPHVLRIIGADTMSGRFAASLVEIERTINTWPQLGSDVTLGGATVAAATRRIVLGLGLPSGRRYVDLEAILASDSTGRSTAGPEEPPARSRPTAPDRVEAAATSLLRFAVEHAVLAPSGGNCQPWRFHADGENQLHLVHDEERSRNLLDGTHFASCLALGAAIENAVIAAAHRGYSTTVQTFPSSRQPAWVASLRFTPGSGDDLLQSASLFELLPRRVTNRRRGDSTPLSPAEAEALVVAADERGARLQLLSDRGQLEEVGRILGEADRIRFLSAAMHREVMGELRWTPEETERTRDGIDLATLELTASEAAVMRVLARPDTASLLRELDAGVALAEGAGKSIQGACAVGLFRARSEDRAGFLELGHAVQRTWLTATRLGLGFQPMSAPLFMFRMLNRPERGVFLERERQALGALEARLNRALPGHEDQPRAFLFRLTRATEVTARSLRRPVSEVLFNGRPE